MQSAAQLGYLDRTSTRVASNWAQDSIAMVFQKATLARRERADIEGRVSPHAHTLQRGPMSDW